MSRRLLEFEIGVHIGVRVNIINIETYRNTTEAITSPCTAKSCCWGTPPSWLWPTPETGPRWPRPWSPSPAPVEACVLPTCPPRTSRGGCASRNWRYSPQTCAQPWGPRGSRTKGSTRIRAKPLSAGTTHKSACAENLRHRTLLVRAQTTYRELRHYTGVMNKTRSQSLDGALY